VIIHAGGNTLDCDVEATLAAFSAYTPKLPWTCSCSGCRNYRAAKDLIYTDRVLSFFAQFGIDTTKPAEIYEGGLIGDVFHCAAWFHFVGSIVHADREPAGTARIFTEAAVDISDVVKVDFNDRRSLLPDSFKGQPVVQLECEFKIPWLLPEPRHR
jgi:hypothetical protein